MVLKLVRYAEVRGVVYCKTGLHIGAGRDDIEIDSMDNPIIRHPISREPYIPGSSLKGKLRSLLEYKYGKIGERKRGEKVIGTPCTCAKSDCPVCTLFGPHQTQNHNLGPTRIIARDAPLTESSARELGGLREQGLNFAEVKNETSIDRRTQIAADGTLRPQERVPAGAEFEMAINVRLFESDNEHQLLQWLGESLELLLSDSLGGSGSRGYGQVEFRNLTLDSQPWTPPNLPVQHR